MQPTPNDSDHWSRFRIETPARYRIRVKGHLNPAQSDYLGGLEITSRKSTDSSTWSELEGRLADQAALAGVLNTLYNLQLPVLSVECLEVYGQ